MRQYRFVTVDVFTDRRFGGNQLAVIPDARGLTSDEMQAIAAEFNFSETTFVLDPDDSTHTARVRIFHRTAELPFAGHPNVGTAFVLAAERDEDMFVFEQKAGVVAVDVHRSATRTPLGATIAAPQPLVFGEEVPVGTLSACVSLQPRDVIVRRHEPRWASTGNPFVFAEVCADALGRATPDVAAFRRAATRLALDGRMSVYLYARGGDCVYTRMFAPLSGTMEDAATGSAAATLGALFLSVSGTDLAELNIVQGIEMSRPSHLRVTAHRRSGEIVSKVGGSCVGVTQGELTL